ncbi:MAG: hypothetical protein KM310_08055, partial [Clostridiales bacterium]|nr:hypothetical protein [Clostridiales bacterium]
LSDTWRLSKAEERGFEAPGLAEVPTYACTVEKKGQNWLVTITVAIRTLAPLNLVGSELLGQKGPAKIVRKAASDTELTLPGTIQDGQLKVFRRGETNPLCRN